jgi:hypothetical protein
MSESTINLLIAAVVSGLFGGGLITGIGALIRSRSGAAKDLSDSAASLVKEYRERVDELSCELIQVKERLETLERIAQMFEDVLAGAHRLFHQVQSLGAIPVYVPPERREDLEQTKPIGKHKKGKIEHSTDAE